MSIYDVTTISDDTAIHWKLVNRKSTQSLTLSKY